MTRRNSQTKNGKFLSPYLGHGRRRLRTDPSYFERGSSIRLRGTARGTIADIGRRKPNSRCSRLSTSIRSSEFEFKTSRRTKRRRCWTSKAPLAGYRVLYVVLKPVAAAESHAKGFHGFEAHSSSLGKSAKWRICSSPYGCPLSAYSVKTSHRGLSTCFEEYPRSCLAARTAFPKATSSLRLLFHFFLLARFEPARRRLRIRR